MKNTLIVIFGILIVIAALFVNAGKAFQAGYSIGDYASDFKLKNIDGKMVSMADYSNAKGIVVVFTCNTCPYAQMYEERLINLNNTIAPKGFPVIAINPNDIKQQPGDTMEEMQKRAKEKNYSFPYLRDDSQDVARMYGASKTPHFYVLNKVSGKYRVEFIGAMDDNVRDASAVTEKYIEMAVDALLQGKSPTIKEKRAIGCTIKWKEA